MTTAEIVIVFLFGALIVLGWLCRKWAVELIVGSVKADFDRQLETLRADVRARESEIGSLREVALANVRNTQAATLQRRVQAVDDLWAAVTEFYRFNWTLMVTGIIKFEDVMEDIERDPKVKEWAQGLANMAATDIESVGAKAHTAQPYVSDIAWALYVAYSTTYMWAATQMKIFKIGTDARSYFDHKGVQDVLIKALPDMKDYILKSGSIGHVHLTGVLRERILAELRNTLAGKEQDADGVARAAAVSKAVDDALEARARSIVQMDKAQTKGG